MAAETALTRVTWRGVRITARQRDAFRTAEAWLQDKYPGTSLIPTQGSWSNGSMSAGTHTGAGACDFRVWHYTTAQRQYMVRCLKDAGHDGWHAVEVSHGSDG